MGTGDLSPLGEYQPLRVLGQGGMGTVLLARHAALGHTVAIKKLRADDDAEPGRAGRLLREAQVLLRLCHPGLVRYLHLGHEAGQPYLVMEHVPGTSLREVLRQGPLALSLALSLIRQVAEAMAHAHQQGVLHRDLKPENILVETSRAKVVDFGIARPLFGKLSSDNQGQITEVQTAEAALLGTPAYMAPEQARGDALTDRADVYALGVVLFEALCARPPFVADTNVVLLSLHQLEPPPPLSSLLPEAPPALSALVAQMLAKDPAARPSMDEVAARLARARESRPHVRRPLGHLVGLFALLVVAVLAWRQARVDHAAPAATLALLQAVHTPIGAQEIREALDLPAFEPDPRQVDLAPLQVPLRDADGIDFAAAGRALEARFVKEVRPLLLGPRRVIYLGMAPIPLAIQLGALLGPLHPVEVYQQHHGTRSWRWPGSGGAAQALVSGLPAARPEAGEVVLRVSVSARIDPLDTRAIVPHALAEVDVALGYPGPGPGPGMDALRTPQDVEEVARAFAQALWTLSERLPALRRIHLFAAVPPALALRLGAVLQPNIHPPVQTYQYRRAGSPRYQAALLVNR